MAPSTRIGLAVMGQNPALNIAEKEYPISVYHRTTSKVDEKVERAKPPNTEDILLKVVAQVPDSGSCVTYIGKGGAGNFVKMVHNGIAYGDMQLISEAYDVLKSVGKLTNEELHQVLSEWFKGELLSFLIEITADQMYLELRMTREKDIWLTMFWIKLA
ncbi:hypothetical protein Peur_018010 [Populus x canadensis]